MEKNVDSIEKLVKAYTGGKQAILRENGRSSWCPSRTNSPPENTSVSKVPGYTSKIASKAIANSIGSKKKDHKPLHRNRSVSAIQNFINHIQQKNGGGTAGVWKQTNTNLHSKKPS